MGPTGRWSCDLHEPLLTDPIWPFDQMGHQLSLLELPNQRIGESSQDRQINVESHALQTAHAEDAADPP